MSTRRRVLGEIAKRQHINVSGIDVPALLRRLILFDQVIIKSVRLRELPFLVRTFGHAGVITALKSGILRLSCEFTVLIEDIAIGGVSQNPPDHFSYGIADIKDRESELRSELIALQSVSGLKNAQRAAIEEAAWAALIRPSSTFGADLQLQVEHDLRTNTPALRFILLQTLKESGVDIINNAGRLDIKVEETSARIFRVGHNLEDLFGLSKVDSQRFVKRAVSGLNRVNSRLADMAAYSAITGFSEAEAPLLFGKLSGLIAPFNPDATEMQFNRIVSIADVGEPSPNSRIDMEKLLEVRESGECRAFRSWLDDASALTDKEIEDVFTSIRSKLGLLISRTDVKMLRFAALTGIGLITDAVIPATILGFVDSFLLEKLFPAPGIVSFLKVQYPSIFDL